MKIIHYCAELGPWNGMACVARMLVDEQIKLGHDVLLTDRFCEIRGHLNEVWVHGAWLWGTWIATLRGRMSGAKVVRIPHGSYDPVRRAYHGWKKFLVGIIERYCLRKADIVVATCEAEKAWILEYELGVNSVKVQDIKRFFNLDSGGGSNARKDGAPLHILYLGRRHPLKGIDFLVEALHQLNGSLRYEFRVVSNAFGDELEKVWDWCDVLVLPTLSDNFGLVIAEALERGKRVITTDGAPAWSDGSAYDGRLIYLKGYRDGSPEERVRLLKKAIEELICQS